MNIFNCRPHSYFKFVGGIRTIHPVTKKHNSCNLLSLEEFRIVQVMSLGLEILEGFPKKSGELFQIFRHNVSEGMLINIKQRPTSNNDQTFNNALIRFPLSRLTGELNFLLHARINKTTKTMRIPS